MSRPPQYHPSFPQPDDPSIVIWRYMDIDRFEWLVNYQRLFMPRVDKLGDPWEGTTPPGDIAWWRDQAQNANSEEQRRIIEYNRGFISHFAREFRERYFVSCWHVNQHENHAMWRCYTKKPEAVAIRTTYRALRDCLPMYVFMGMVRYIEYATERLPATGNMFECIMHKDTYYKYEEEVRAVAFQPFGEGPDAKHFNENFFEKEDSPGIFVFAPSVDIIKLIQGVVLHPDAQPKFQETVTELCMKNGLPKPEESRSTRPPVF